LTATPVFEAADALQNACRHCATIGSARLSEIFTKGLVPQATDDTATVTFVKINGRTYAVTAQHVIDHLQSQSADTAAPNPFFIPSGKGAIIQPPFIRAPESVPLPKPDIALRMVDDALPAHIGKEPFVFDADVTPPSAAPYAVAVGFPTLAKFNVERPQGTHLALPCVQAVAEGRTTAQGADQLQFFSEITVSAPVASLSGMSGGPVFWSDHTRYGLLGFVKEALDVIPKPGEPSLYAGPRVHFLCQRTDYAMFALWAAHTDAEFPKEREKLNRRVSDG
jgi:hypothetical protein